MTTVGPGGEAQPGTVVLAASGLRKSYRCGPEQVHALRGASLTLHAGEVVALLGPSGSGKTTLLNVICGWERPDAGQLTWPASIPGLPARGVPQPWSELAIVPQDLGLIEELSVEGNVQLPLWLSGRLDADGHAHATALLDRLGLTPYADRAPGEVSLGEQQRVALARAMILVPRLLLADEPTGHQDATWATAIFESFRHLATLGTCCLIATHSQEFLDYTDRTLTIHDGQLPVGE
jgi:putative ABC transport system ATP-binding protein